MRNFPTLAAVATCSLSSAHGISFTPEEQATAVAIRAFAANNPYGYTPQTVKCPPATPRVRDATHLSSNESAWLEVRRNATVESMRDLLSRLNITGLDTDAYINSKRENASALPNVAIAVSGGGYRAMLTGAGFIQASDSRTPGSTASGQLGGLLQSSTYLSALSGGSWLVASLYGNNFTSVDSILALDTSDSESGDIWQFENTIFQGPDTGGIQLFDSIGYYASIVRDVRGKESAGFNTTITDYWGRMLSHQLINASDGGPAYTFSSIAQQQWFTNGQAPLPLIVADGRSPGEKIISGNSTVFSFSPWEFGSNDPTVFSFAPLQYIGTNYSGGSPRDLDECVVGFDNIGFVLGTSSSLFNAILTTVNGTDTTGLLSSALQQAVVAILSRVGDTNDDIADWPNPFYHHDNGTNINSQAMQLTLVDGGEDNQNVPLHPVIQPNRNVDVIFAIDSSADTTDKMPTNFSAQNWPDGASLVATYERSLTEIGNGTVFPPIPDINTFFNLGLNNRPTFFGCDAANLTGPAPLVVYLPNAPYTYNSNVTTFDPQYNNSERNAIVLNGYNLATQGNGTLDNEWPACVGCAILSRSLDRTRTEVPDVCTRCFDRYCWDGTTDSSTPNSYVPEMKLAAVESGAGKSVASATLALALTALTGVLLV